VTTTRWTRAGIAYDRAGPRGDLPVVLLHAGVADRRMWDAQWPALAAERDVVRLDLRGFGESAVRPQGALSPVDDVLDTLAELDIERCHLVGASAGAGVAVEVALTRPEQVASLLLCPPGGSLIAEVTPDLRAFIDAERSALAGDDLDGAVEANLAWWVEGPERNAGGVDPTVRDASPTRAASTGRTPPTCRRWNTPMTSSPCCATGWRPGGRTRGRRRRRRAKSAGGCGYRRIRATMALPQTPAT